MKRDFNSKFFFINGITLLKSLKKCFKSNISNLLSKLIYAYENLINCYGKKLFPTINCLKYTFCMLITVK